MDGARALFTAKIPLIYRGFCSGADKNHPKTSKKPAFLQKSGFFLQFFQCQQFASDKTLPIIYSRHSLWLFCGRL